jgi:hypothetical protein
MKLRTRIAKLQDQVRVRAGRRTIRDRYLKDKTFAQVLDLVEEAIAPESWPVMEDIIRQIEEYAAQPPRELCDGDLKPYVHGFLLWLCYVQEGHAPLPETIPHALLLAYRNGHAHHPCKPLATPIPIVLCLDCEMVLPNSTVEGGLPWISPCPVCGSENLKHFFGLHRDPRLAWYFGPPACGTPSPPSCP